MHHSESVETTNYRITISPDTLTSTHPYAHSCTDGRLLLGLLRLEGFQLAEEELRKVKNADAMPIVGAVYLQVRRCKQ